MLGILHVYELLALNELSTSNALPRLRVLLFFLLLPAGVFAITVCGGIVGSRIDLATRTTLRDAYNNAQEPGLALCAFFGMAQLHRLRLQLRAHQRHHVPRRVHVQHAVHAALRAGSRLGGAEPGAAAAWHRVRGAC